MHIKYQKKFGKRFRARQRWHDPMLVLMNATSFAAFAPEAPAYVALQREMHNALLVQHPEWIERNGNCPKCDDYDRRFAQLLSFFLTFERANAHQVLSYDSEIREKRTNKVPSLARR